MLSAARVFTYGYLLLNVRHRAIHGWVEVSERGEKWDPNLRKLYY